LSYLSLIGYHLIITSVMILPRYFSFYHMPCYVTSFTSPSAYQLPLTSSLSLLQTPL
jgi:hypothetical protein